MGIRAVDVRLEDRGGVMLCGGGRCRVGRRGAMSESGAGHEGSMTVEVSSNGVEYTRGAWRCGTTGGKADCGGAEHRSRGRRDGGEVGGRRDDAWGDAQPVPIWARHDREPPVRWESSSVVACTAPRSGDLVGNVTVELVGEEGGASGTG